MTWTHKFADLLAVGVHVDVEAIHVLEKGGEILSLEVLPAPDSFLYGDGDIWPMNDHDGDTAMVPFVMKIDSVDLPYYQGYTKNAITIAEQLEENVGEAWRRFPSYVGMKTNTAIEDPRGTNEYPIPVRVWNAIPLLTEQDRQMASMIVVAHRLMIAVSYYEELVAFYQTHMEMTEGWSDLNIDDLTDELTLQYWELRTKLAQQGYIIEDPELEKEGQWSEGRPIDLDPLDLYLKDLGARRMWAQLRHTSKQCATRVFNSVPLSRQSAFVHNEKEYEPWF